VKRYVDKGYVSRDPVITELERTLHMFSWGDVLERRTLTSQDFSAAAPPWFLGPVAANETTHFRDAI
jgi:hypothetical protein